MSLLTLSFVLDGPCDPQELTGRLEGFSALPEVRVGVLEDFTHVDCTFDRGGRGTGPATILCGQLLKAMSGKQVLAGGVGKHGRVRAEEWAGVKPVDGPKGDFRSIAA